MEEEIKENSFSIIIPVAERKNLVQKANTQRQKSDVPELGIDYY
jgi:hypothetical protein